MPLPEPSAVDPIRVLIVDDSAVIRGFVSRALADVDNVVVVGSAPDGQAGVSAIKRDLVDVVILDIEMPVMDGLAALPEIRKASPWSRVVMSSTLTVQGAEVSLRALALGAADYVAKPTSTRDAGAADFWKQDLLAKVQALGQAAWRERQRLGKTGPLPVGVLPKTPAARPAAGGASSAALPLSPSGGVGAAAAPKSRLYEGSEVRLRPAALARPFPPDIVAIGSSTGGPQALFEVLPHLRGLKQPVVITQHMPRTFTTILAEHISRQTGLPCTEAKAGDVLTEGRALLAPGDFHMLFERVGTDVKVKLTQDPPENFCRPAVDPMLRSLSAAYGPSKMLMAILTGMGADGMRGADPVVNGGGVLVAQDQPTSVVWGMPGAVATAGLCTAVLPLAEIGPWLRRKAMGALA